MPDFREGTRKLAPDYSSGYFSASWDNTKENKYYIITGLYVKIHTHTHTHTHTNYVVKEDKKICFFLR